MVRSIFTPPTQKAESKPISFLLDAGASEKPSADSCVTLYIRPEDFSMTIPARTATHQTFGGFWVDSFGEGVRRITISGVTGWHPDGLLSAEGGLERFKNLQKVVFTDYHKKRTEAVENSKDPGKIKVVYVDRLNDICSVVSPVSFTLKRSKSRPLMYQYQITLDVVEPEADSSYVTLSTTAASNSSLKALGSLSASLSSLSTFSSDMSLASGLSCATELAKFGTTAYGVLANLGEAYKTGGIFSAGMGALSVGMSAFGTDVCQVLCSTTGISMDTLSQLMKGASTFGNVYCILKNAIKSGLKISDYKSLLGSSYCSSTSGGADLSALVLSGTNAFSSVLGTSTATATTVSEAGVTVSSDAQKALSTPVTSSNVASLLTTVNNGITQVADSSTSFIGSALQSIGITKTT